MSSDTTPDFTFTMATTPSASIASPRLPVRSTFKAYLHESLEPGFIRILHLVPGTGSDPFCCYIENVELSSRPGYDALSYVWGNPVLTHKVLCYDSEIHMVMRDTEGPPKSIGVTSNLAAALRHLRHPSSIRSLWIDQICIDQKNNLEKNDQVSRMGNIFAQAHETVAWLGPDEAGMAPVVHQFFDHLIQLQIPRELQLSSVSLHSIDPSLERPDNPAWPALREFELLPYFKRVWIVQELLLSSNVTFYWGKEAIASRESLREVYRKYYYLNYRPEIQQHLHHTGANRVQDSLWARKEYHRLLDGMQIRDATDPRDKLYALTNVVADVVMPNPDYRKEHTQAFIDITTAVIKQKQNLLPTYDTSTNVTVDESWPSWVPKLEYRLGRPGGFLCDTLFSHSQQNAGFRTHDDTPFRFSVNGAQLSVDGFLYDNITDIDSASWNYRADPLDIISCSIIPAWRLYQRRTKEETLLDGGFRDFIETLIGGRFNYWDDSAPIWTDHILLKFAVDMVQCLVTNFEGSANNEDYFIDTIHLTSWSLRVCGKILTDGADLRTDGELLSIDAETLDDWRVRLSILEKLAHETGESHESVQNIAWEIFHEMQDRLPNTVNQFTRTWSMRGARRRFFFLRSNLMGIGPYCMADGDVVAIIYGDCMPYVLRPVDRARGQYRLLGECYVHGIMEGQAIRLLQEIGELESHTSSITLI